MADTDIAKTTETDSTPNASRAKVNTMPKDTTAVKSINRFGIGFIIALQLVLAAVCVIFINYLTAPHHVRKDLTDSKDFTLSEYSQNLLQSDLIQNYEGKIKFIALLKPNSPHKQRIRGKLEEYRRFAPDKIEFEIVDYVKEASRFNELSSIYGKTFYEETILIDARTDAELKKEKPSNAAPTTSFLDKGEEQPLQRIRQFSVSELYFTSEDGSRIAAWQDEKLITSFLLSATEGKSRRFYLIVDKSQVDDAGGGTPAWNAFKSHLDSQNIQLNPFQISSGQPIPADAEGLVMIGLDSDFDKPEINILKEYWDRNNASLFITVSADAKLTNIRRFMKSYGIAVEKDRVLSVGNGHTLTKARGNFIKGSDITKGFGEKSTQLDGPTRSLSLANTDQLAVKNIAVFPVLQAAPGWWGEVEYNKPTPRFDPGKDNGSAPNAERGRALFLAAAVVRGREDLDRTKNLTSKMIVIGNTQFLKPANMRSELTHFVNSSINWLAGREALVGSIGSKPVRPQKITIKAEDKAKLDLTVIVIIPAIGFIISMLFWWNRRS